MTVPDDDLAALTVDQLKARLADVRGERMSVQRAAGRRGAAELALRSAERDEASVVNDELVALRDRAQRLHDGVLDVWRALDSRLTNFHRLDAATAAFSDDDRAEVAMLERAVNENRADAHRQIVALGLAVPGIGGV